MKLILPAFLALSLAVPATASATVVQAGFAAQHQDLLIKVDGKGKGKHRGKGHRRHGDDRYNRDDWRDERRAYRQGYRDGRWESRGQGYYQPGYREHRRYGRGDYLPREYRSYVVHDYGRYGYPPPPRDCRYVRVGGDTYLMQMATGLILNAFLGGGY